MTRHTRSRILNISLAILALILLSLGLKSSSGSIVEYACFGLDVFILGLMATLKEGISSLPRQTKPGWKIAAVGIVAIALTGVFAEYQHVSTMSVRDAFIMRCLEQAKTTIIQSPNECLPYLARKS